MSQRDRFQELQNSNSNNTSYGNSYELQQLTTNTLNHSASNSTLNTQHPATNLSFFQTAENIKRNIEQVHINTRNLDALNRRALSEFNLQNRLLADIHTLSDKNNNLVQIIRTQIKSLMSIQGEQKNIKQTQQKALAKKLMEAARTFQEVQASAKRNYKQQMERQYRIARPNATPEQIEAALTDTNGRVFQQELLNARFGEQRAALEEMRSRHTEIELIEQSIEELFNLFQDMQLLIDSQQGEFDTIDQHTDEVVVSLEDASKQMTSAVASAKSARAKKWCLCICVLVLIAIAIILIYIYVIKPMVDQRNAENAAKNAQPSASPK